jgi:hypothetical protein
MRIRYEKVNFRERNNSRGLRGKPFESHHGHDQGKNGIFPPLMIFTLGVG